MRGVAPDPALRTDQRYRELFDFPIAQKRRGFAVNGSLAYLRGMRDLERFRCRPSTVLAVLPVGDVFSPCLEIGKVAGILLAEPDLHKLCSEGMRLPGMNALLVARNRFERPRIPRTSGSRRFRRSQTPVFGTP